MITNNKMVDNIIHDSQAMNILQQANARQSHLVRALREQEKTLLSLIDKAIMALTTQDAMPAEQCQRIADMLRKARRVR